MVYRWWLAMKMVYLQYIDFIWYKVKSTQVRLASFEAKLDSDATWMSLHLIVSAAGWF